MPRVKRAMARKFYDQNDKTLARVRFNELVQIAENQHPDRVAFIRKHLRDNYGVTRVEDIPDYSIVVALKEFMQTHVYRIINRREPRQ